jgi:hypothetical protein
MKKTRKAITAQGDDETMNRKAKSVLMRGMLAALVISAVFAGPASASPAWNFAGTELTGSETVMGAAIDSSLTIPGLTTKCENFLYKLTIKNEAKVGKGELTEMPLYNCTTNSSACTVKTIAAETLPWPAKLSKIEPSNYVIIEGVKVGISYAGTECVLKGIAVKVTGSAGGLLDNATETATFNSSTLATTKTELKALSQKIEWNGLFPTEAFEWHREQALSVS